MSDGADAWAGQQLLDEQEYEEYLDTLPMPDVWGTKREVTARIICDNGSGFAPKANRT